MAFAGVDDRQSGSAEGGEQPCRRRNDCLQKSDLVAQCFAETAGLDEVALHVDDDEGRMVPIEVEVEGTRLDDCHQ